jgi:hypothetical protein
MNDGRALLHSAIFQIATTVEPQKKERCSVEFLYGIL